MQDQLDICFHAVPKVEPLMSLTGELFLIAVVAAEMFVGWLQIVFSITLQTIAGNAACSTVNGV